MEFRKLLGFLEILNKSIKIVSKNGRLMVVVTSVYLIVYSLFFVLNLSSIKPIITDLITKGILLPSLDPQGLLFAQSLVTILKDVKTLVGVEIAFLLTLFVISLFAQNAIILVTGASCNDKKISNKDFISKVPRGLTRLFITSFHVTLLRVGFLYFGSVTLMVPTIMVSEYKIVYKMILWALIILVVTLYLYFSVVWVLSLVVSVLEECSGIEALGKAGRLVKGKKLEGLFLNILTNLLAYPFFHVLIKFTLVSQSELTQTLFRFFVMSCICLLITFKLQAYTVLYFECKKNDGEEIELHGNVEYSKIPTTAIVPDHIP